MFGIAQSVEPANQKTCQRLCQWAETLVSIFELRIYNILLIPTILSMPHKFSRCFVDKRQGASSLKPHTDNVIMVTSLQNITLVYFYLVQQLYLEVFSNNLNVLYSIRKNIINKSSIQSNYDLFIFISIRT